MSNILFQAIFPPQPKGQGKTILTHCLQFAGDEIGTFKPMFDENADLNGFERIVFAGQRNGKDFFLCYAKDEYDYAYLYLGVAGEEFNPQPTPVKPVKPIVVDDFEDMEADVQLEEKYL